MCKGLNENRSLVSQNEIGEKGIIQGLKYITTTINRLIFLDISKNRFSDEGLITLTNQMKDFPNKLKYKNFERIKPYFNYFGFYTLCDDSMSKIKKRNLFQI
jgi:hypothetical protein